MGNGKLYAAALPVILAGLALAGCGGDQLAEKAAETAVKANTSEQGQEVDVDIDSEKQSFSMSVQGESGSMDMTAGENAKLPDDFPEDVPLYPGMKLQVVSTMDGQEMHMIQGSTGDDLETVAARLAKDAQSNGWTEAMSMNMGAQQRMLNYTQGDRILNYAVMREEGATQISVTTGNK